MTYDWNPVTTLCTFRQATFMFTESIFILKDKFLIYSQKSIMKRHIVVEYSALTSLHIPVMDVCIGIWDFS